MHTFSEIEGLSGEGISSSLLRCLIFSSPRARDKCIMFLSDNSPVGPSNVQMLA